MTLMQAVKSCFGNYFTVSGRAARSEYWKFVLFLFLVSVVLTILNSLLFGPALEIKTQMVIAADGTQSVQKSEHLSYSSGIFGTLFGLATLVPIITATGRRLHDRGRSAWWLLMPALVSCIAVFATIILTIGWGPMVDAISSTGGVKVHNPTGWPFAALAVFGSFIALFVWLVRASHPGPNKYGPEPTGDAI